LLGALDVEGGSKMKTPDEAEERIRKLEEQLEALQKLEATLRSGWPKSVLVDRDGTNEEMLAFPLSTWWPVRDALMALDQTTPLAGYVKVGESLDGRVDIMVPNPRCGGKIPKEEEAPE
jgi:hypothetical protein